MNYNELPPPAAKVFIWRQPFYYTKKSGLSSRHRRAKKDEKSVHEYFKNSMELCHQKNLLGLEIENLYDEGNYYLFDKNKIKEHQKALKILQDNIGKLHELAKYLYEHETITGEEFMKILNAPVQVPTAVAESESNTKSENNAESENSTEADADTSSGKVNLQK